MRRTRLFVSPLARRHLRHIGDFIAADNPQRAASFIEEIVARCRELQTFPSMGPVERRRQDVEVRKIVHGRYRIYYRLQEDAVGIIAIQPGSMDVEKILPEDGELPRLA